MAREFGYDQRLVDGKRAALREEGRPLPGLVLSVTAMAATFYVWTQGWSPAYICLFVVTSVVMMLWITVLTLREVREIATESRFRYSISPAGLERVGPDGTSRTIPLLALSAHLVRGTVTWRDQGDRGTILVGLLEDPVTFALALARAVLEARGCLGRVSGDEPVAVGTMRWQSWRSVARHPFTWTVAVVTAVTLWLGVASDGLFLAEPAGIGAAVATLVCWAIAMCAALGNSSLSHRFAPAGLDFRAATWLFSVRGRMDWRAVDPAPGQRLPVWPAQGVPPPGPVDPDEEWLCWFAFHDCWKKNVEAR